MPEPDHWLADYYQLAQDLCSVLGVFPLNQEQKDDPERALLERALWRRLYKRQIVWRLPDIAQE